MGSPPASNGILPEEFWQKNRFRSVVLAELPLIFHYLLVSDIVLLVSFINILQAQRLLGTDLQYGITIGRFSCKARVLSLDGAIALLYFPLLLSQPSLLDSILHDTSDVHFFFSDKNTHKETKYEKYQELRIITNKFNFPKNVKIVLRGYLQIRKVTLIVWFW